MSLDDVAGRFELVGLRASERDFAELAQWLDTKHPDPLKALLFASGYIGWVIATMQANKILEPHILAQLPLLVTQVEMRVYIETKKRLNEQPGEEGPAPASPG